MRRGALVGGLVTVPDIDAALDDYRDTLGLRLVADGPVGEGLAEAWGVSAIASARMVTLQPASRSHCFIRLIEQPIPGGFEPTTTFGWAAFELTVQDVFGWPARLEGSGFRVIGPPREIAGMPYFVPMQVHGPGREMLYLNEVRCDTPSSDLPKANSPVDHMFIAILAAPDRAAAVAWYRDRLGLDEGDSYVIEYTMINRAFDLPPGTTSGLTMVQNGRLPIVEIDDYPPQANVRPREPGCLPPGNAMITLAVDHLDACRCEWIAPPTNQDGPLYRGARSATAVGSAGELIELVELAR